MAKRQATTAFLGIPSNTPVDVIATKDCKHFLSQMTFGEWQVLKKKSGFYYQCFQKGFHQFILENKK